MIHHYVNLVCWDAISLFFNKTRDRLWLDSVSSRVLVGLFRKDAAYRPGTKALTELLNDGDLGIGWFFLTARPLRNVPAASQITLPLLADGADIEVPTTIMTAVGLQPPGTKIALGIGSPKQNWIAVQLYEWRPDLEYHCFGAALFNLEETTADRRNAARLSGSGIEWVSFLRKYPRRTLLKVKTTMLEIGKILAVPSIRRQFQDFSMMCEPRNVNSDCKSLDRPAPEDPVPSIPKAGSQPIPPASRRR